MEKLSNTEAELKKSVDYKKGVYFQMFFTNSRCFLIHLGAQWIVVYWANM